MAYHRLIAEERRDRRASGFRCARSRPQAATS